MNKAEFLNVLQSKLCGLPKEEVRERIDFYVEMIDDRIEEGLTEEEAVMAVGSVDKIVEQIIADFPLTKLAKERIRPKRRMRVWEIVLLALGSPIWLSLAIVAFAVILSLYVVLWAVAISLWAVFVSVAACALAGLVAGVVFAFCSNAFTGIAMIGASIFCQGLSIFMFFGCKEASRGIVLLTKKIALGIKKLFVKKEEAR